MLLNELISNVSEIRCYKANKNKKKSKSKDLWFAIEGTSRKPLSNVNELINQGLYNHFKLDKEWWSDIYNKKVISYKKI